MFNAIKEFFFGKPAAAPAVDAKVEAANQAPYKVETPVVDLADIAIVQTPAAVVEVKAAPAAPAVEEVKAAPAKKPAKMTASKKPAAPKKPAGAKKGGRKPKA